ncbi:hypothetical protein LSTR_LSTR006785 [Laodelphax striatellus]|uniref:Uncharacterized protein n=1 Tax=Laodelphax striatellus TaxID=195883 RepID=A0A482WTE5_LAOST|nr:hypothetical protein LSTR_LSTR006785 [Laodelphax striatellus]
MPKYPKAQAASSRDGGGNVGVNSAKSTPTGDLPPIQFIIHADPETLCKCCGGQDGQNAMQGFEAFCRRCCDKYLDEPRANQAQDKRQYQSQDRGPYQGENYPTMKDFSVQTDEGQTHFHKHLYNASLLQKYCGGNIFVPPDDEAPTDSADEISVEEATDATQTDESEFPKVKLVRMLSDAETQTIESILSQLKAPQATSTHTMKQVNTSLTMISSQNPFLYNFNESSSIDDILQPYCYTYCQSDPTSRHPSASPSRIESPRQSVSNIYPPAPPSRHPSMTEASKKSLSNIYQVPSEERKSKSDSLKSCFKLRKSRLFQMQENQKLRKEDKE